jgi:hypothetical protein
MESLRGKRGISNMIYIALISLGIAIGLIAGFVVFIIFGVADEIDKRG